MANWENLPNTTTPLNATNMEKLYSLDIGSSNIVSGTDLNTLTAPGTYRCASGAIASTLINSPSNGVFKLIVEYLRNSSSIRQTLIQLSQNNITYVRSADANGFGSWQRVITDNEWSLVDIDWTLIGVADTTVKYRKKGNIVTVTGNSSAFELGTNYTTVATLPTGARPTERIYGIWTKLGTNETGSIRFETNGQIQLYGGTTAEKFWAFSATFII